MIFAQWQHISGIFRLEKSNHNLYSLNHSLRFEFFFFFPGFTPSVDLGSDNACRNNPEAIQELKAEVTHFTRRIPNEMCQRFTDNFAVRLNACMNRRVGHIEHFTHYRDWRWGPKLKNHETGDCDLRRKDNGLIFSQETNPQNYGITGQKHYKVQSKLKM